MKHLKNFEQYKQDKTELDISYKNLVTFPQEYLPLHNSLQRLDCYHNNLTSLPELPNSLQKIWCFNNNLTSLPELPNSLQVLACSLNNLTSLPELPNLLRSLDCSENNITNLPKLPETLQYLQCYNNNLTSLPKLPNYLTHYNLSGNAWENPVPFDIFDKSYKGYININKWKKTFYTPKQQKKFKSYQYQKKFMQTSPFDWKDLDVKEIGIHSDIRKEFDFIFEYDSYKL